jgi:glutathione S-transferase
LWCRFGWLTAERAVWRTGATVKPLVAIAEAKAEIEKHFAILSQHLAVRTYLVAEQFSLADICYMPFLEFLPLMEITTSTAVAAWSERLLARPSAVATRPEK